MERKNASLAFGHRFLGPAHTTHKSDPERSIRGCLYIYLITPILCRYVLILIRVGTLRIIHACTCVCVWGLYLIFCFMGMSLKPFNTIPSPCQACQKGGPALHMQHVLLQISYICEVCCSGNSMSLNFKCLASPHIHHMSSHSPHSEESIQTPLV